MSRPSIIARQPGKFSDPDWTAEGEPRASVPFRSLRTLWFNTGTLCNIECANCYIESSPANDRLAYLTEADIAPYLDELDAMGSGAVEVAFTGGEPYMNPDMNAMTGLALNRGHRVLVLTNAMRPLMRPQVRRGLEALRASFGDRLTLRVSIDHCTAEYHDEERGRGSFRATCEGLRWLAQNRFRLSAAGRSRWDEDERQARAGFARLFSRLGADIPADDPSRLVIFPEMEEATDPPEITTSCWSALSVDPASIMCASSRMVVKRRGAARPVVVSCTLLPYDDAFQFGESLAASLAPVKLRHRYCAQFCVLGGASCS